MNAQPDIYSKLLEAVTLAHDDLTRPIGPALPAPKVSPSPDPEITRDTANKAVIELRDFVLDRLAILRAQIDSAEQTVKMACDLVLTHHGRLTTLASATLEGADVMEKAINELTQQAASNGK